MEIRQVSVVGMGTMGSQIGIVCAQAGFQTMMVDIMDDKVKAGLESIRSFLKNRQQKGKLEIDTVDKILSLISADTDMAKALSARTW